MKGENIIMSNSVKVRNVTLGENQPKIAVPITGTTEEEILKQAKAISEAKPDIIEWRVDYFEFVTNYQQLEVTGSKLRKLVGDIAILATFRTHGEGGELELSDEKYFEICDAMANGTYADAVDLERFHDVTAIKNVINSAHQNKKIIVMSNHDFHATPAESTIIERLAGMEGIGADVAKIAVMPNGVDDVLQLMAATQHAKTAMNIPIITMSMGDLGKVSRAAGELFGSTLTFATVTEASAPGQIEINKLRDLTETLKLSQN